MSHMRLVEGLLRGSTQDGQEQGRHADLPLFGSRQLTGMIIVALMTASWVVIRLAQGAQAGGQVIRGGQSFGVVLA